MAVENLVDDLFKSAFDMEAPKTRSASNALITATGFGCAGIGVLSTIGAFILNQQAKSLFDKSGQTLADYDQGLETTYYANTALSVGLSATAMGGIILWVSQ